MSEDTKLQQLIINTLSPEQMPEVLSDTEIYLVEDDVEYASIDELNTHTSNTTIHVTTQNKTTWNNKQDAISDLSTIRTNAQTGANLAPQVAINTQRIEDLTTSRIPDVIYRGTPKITGGQITNFSTTNYLLFPFEDISRGLPFDIYFSFTTDDDVTTQQNIIDSKFGIALAILNSKGVMALSSNGINWDIGSVTGTVTLLPNTTYYVKYSWTGTEYKTYISTNSTFDTTDMVLPSTLSPFKTTIYIGGCDQQATTHTPHPFKGIINFTKSRVDVNGVTVWEGMADVGIASRANVSLNNLDEVGEHRFNMKQDVTDTSLTTSVKTIVGAINEINSKTSVPDLDEKTISLNDTNKLQAIAVIDNKNNAIKTWTGTLEEYNSINTKDSNTLYNITDDTMYQPSTVYTKQETDTKIVDVFSAMYPIGAIFIGTTATCPLANFFGTWQLVGQDKVLQGAGTRGTVGTTINESLPNIRGNVGFDISYHDPEGAFYGSGDTPDKSFAYDGKSHYSVLFDASRSSSTYQDNAPVQQDAYLVNIWERVA